MLSRMIDVPAFPLQRGPQQEEARSYATDESFSLCLLTMDDTSRLSEWLAYHYFALPLRYLVVAVDPSSQVSPSYIFDRWRDKMTIVEWTDSNFLANPSSYRHTENMAKWKRYKKHLKRQGEFYRACTAHMMSQNRTWTFYYDADEYVSINEKFLNTTYNPSSKPGHVLTYLKQLTQETDRSSEWPYLAFQNQGLCLSIPRALFGANESTAAERSKKVPPFLNATNFDTLRFRHRMTPPGDRNGLTKSLIDVSQVLPQHLRHGGKAHSALNSICNPNRFNRYDDMPIHIHHIVGSYEAFMFKDDPHRGPEYWNAAAYTEKDWGQEDELRPWIQGFVDLVGEEQAKYLLQDAGVLPTKSVKKITTTL